MKIKFSFAMAMASLAMCALPATPAIPTVPHMIRGERVGVPYFPYAVLHDNTCYTLTNKEYGARSTGVLVASPPVWIDNRPICPYG